MKKALMITFLALLTSAALVGCGQNQAKEEPKENVASSDVVNETPKEENTEAKQEATKDAVELGDKIAEGESVDGTIYGNGKYRITNASDAIVVEWVHELTKSITNYNFKDDKLTSVTIELDYTKEEDAKSAYDDTMKDESLSKKIKDLKLDGKKITYKIVDSELEQFKDYTKDKFFEQCKKEYEELSKVDDIRSDD